MGGRGSGFLSNRGRYGAGVQSLMYPSIDLGDAESHLGADTYRRGLDYARKGRVVRCSWNPGNDSLTGSVRGNRGRAYTTTAHS
ncbi:hypothetical protein LAUMK136_02594 [Mycobacterium attenuatum]|uniref:Uncharacterized protein n=1 Tax=Mycobacterium attenuatum TaxID=2341086 RepID=A0A498PXZ2_9MYCO|nr:hypothetical protein LAUMK136_02594 [Mycobacterium attenuatum]